MGQEWAASSPFLFFTDHDAELGRQVTEGRRREFRAFRAFADPAARDRIPDPQASETFLRSRLEWTETESEPHASVLRLYRALLDLRRREPLLRPNDWDGFGVVPYGSTGLVLARSTPTLASLVVAVQWTGAGSFDLGSVALESVPIAARWEVVLSTEETRFCGDPRPPRIEHAPSKRPVIRFERPGAVILKAGDPALSPHDFRVQSSTR
jgi:maltooligosyltrehalose trehalohydrolase